MIPRVLIIDDDEDVALLYGGYLRDCHNWDVVYAQSGAEALACLESGFHAVVLDERMPGMKGADVLREIRRRPDLERICVIMLTATWDKSIAAQTLEYAPNAYLRKTNTSPNALYQALLSEIEKMIGVVQPLRVFLCHSSRDKLQVRDLYRRLRNDHTEPWLDEENLLAGQDWDFEIRKAVKASHIVVVCLSPSVTRAGYLQKEVGYALDAADEQPEGSIFIIPVKLTECEVPSRLSRWQWIELWRDGAYESLVRSIRARERALGFSANQ